VVWLSAHKKVKWTLLDGTTMTGILKRILLLLIVATLSVLVTVAVMSRRRRLEISSLTDHTQNTTQLKDANLNEG